MSKIRYELEDGEIQLIDIPQELLNKINNDSYNQALEDAEKRYKEWSKSEYGKVVSDDALPIRVLRSLRK